MSDEPDLLSLLYLVPVAIGETDRQGNVALLNPLGCQLLMSITPDPDLTNLFSALAFEPALQSLVDNFAPKFGVVCEGYRVTCKTQKLETLYLEFTIHRLEEERFLFAFRDVTKAVINEQRVAQTLKNLENLISSIARLQVETQEVEIVLEPLLLQVAQWIGRDAAVLLRANSSGKYDILMRVGKLLDEKDLSGLTINAGENLVAANNYALYTGAQPAGLDEEAGYLLKLFVQAAAQAMENAALQEKLVRQERLSAVGQAMSSVVHDLRNPIASIQTAIDMAELKKDDPKVVARMHCLVLSSVDTAFAVVNDLLDFVRKAPVQTTRQDMQAMLNTIVENSQPVRERTGAELRLENTASSVRADAGKLGRALLNLVNNACEAMDGQEGGLVVLSARPEGNGVVITVSDNGPGVPAQVRDSLFEAFATHGKAGGTGLGLAITKQLVEAHGGTIRVESGAQGTCFTVTLPE